MEVQVVGLSSWYCFGAGSRVAEIRVFVGFLDYEEHLWFLMPSIKEPCKQEACNIQSCLTKNAFNPERYLTL